MTLYQMTACFFIYAFMGWCGEVAFAAFKTGTFVNRGFLNGPVCPIYGFGVVLTVLLLQPVSDNLLLLFLGAVLVTSTLEFLTGFLLEKIFHDKWWDYSEEKWNLCGYICLPFSLLWGLLCVLIVKLLQPLLLRMVAWVPYSAGLLLLAVFLLIILIDVSVTATTVYHFNKRLRLMDEFAANLKKLSDEIGTKVADGVLDMVELSEDMSQKRAELKELRYRYRKLLENRIAGHRRILKAFPRFRSLKYDEMLQMLKKYHKLK